MSNGSKLKAVADKDAFRGSGVEMLAHLHVKRYCHERGVYAPARQAGREEEEPRQVRAPGSLRMKVQ